VTAAGAAGLGAKVALIERSLMGGDCLNVGCVPSKGVISAARIAATVKNAREFGVEVPEGVHVNFASAMERMRTPWKGCASCEPVSARTTRPRGSAILVLMSTSDKAALLIPTRSTSMEQSSISNARSSRPELEPQRRRSPDWTA